MPSLLRYAQGCGMSTDDKFLLLLPYKSSAVVGIYAWWQLHSESDQFFVLGSWNILPCDLVWSEPVRIGFASRSRFDLDIVTVMV